MKFSGKSRWVVNTKIRLIIFFAAKDGEAVYSQQKQDQELTVAQTMEPRWPLELLRGSQAPRRAVCGTRGSLRTMHGSWLGGSVAQA